ncbi:thymidylate kinase [Methanocalculus alkaliphilus]|uniref:AAA family ATPase n=1 Tax=Methanocalculus alkaliphilus TaxID=768730 RepID=UPI0020A1A040|nr:AAA family ATPase [Methanocalculus alkaliphilus]MCP1715602.1 thymidylate kinase [Methanocalculus alkaliphilus]
MKILIIGTLGAGKTTLARALSDETGFPYTSIDDCRIRYSDGSIVGEETAWDYFLEACSDPSPAILEFSGMGPYAQMVCDALLGSKLPVAIIWIDWPHDLCIERASKREKNIPAPYIWAPIDYSVPAIYSGIEIAWEEIWSAEPSFQTMSMAFSRDAPPSEVYAKVESYLRELVPKRVL